MKELSLWLRKKKAIEEFGLSEKRLRTLRKNKHVTHRFEGKEFLYETASLINYANGNAVKADVPESQNGDGELMLLTKEVLRKERELEVMRKEKILKKETNNV